MYLFILGDTVLMSSGVHTSTPPETVVHVYIIRGIQRGSQCQRY